MSHLPHAALAASVLLAASVHGQITVVTALSGPNQVLLNAAHIQNFDTLENTGTGHAWSDNQTLPGWYASHATLSAYSAGTGSSATGGLYSFGSSGSSDRALGSLVSGTTQTISYGLRLVNGTGATLTGLAISYDGEQWRRGSNTPQRAESLTVAYGLFVAGAGSLGAAPANWTSIAALAFVSPNATENSALALDGNAAENRSPGIQATLTNLVWLPGHELWLRWTDLDHTGNDHGMAIDNVVIVPIPEPALLAACLGLAALAAVAAVRRQRRRRACSVRL
jgi:uncharacterized protein